MRQKFAIFWRGNVMILDNIALLLCFAISHCAWSYDAQDGCHVCALKIVYQDIRLRGMCFYSGEIRLLNKRDPTRFDTWRIGPEAGIPLSPVFCCPIKGVTDLVPPSRYYRWTIDFLELVHQPIDASWNAHYLVGCTPGEWPSARESPLFCVKVSPQTGAWLKHYFYGLLKKDSLVDSGFIIFHRLIIHNRANFLKLFEESLKSDCDLD